MRLLSRYVLREFLFPLCYCLTGFVFIYVLFELFGNFSRILGSGMPWTDVIRYFLAYLSPYFMWLAPAALMLATLYTMWNFCRHSEIVAMRASGVSFFAIVKPLLFVAVVVAGCVAWVNECYVPEHAQWAKQIRTERFNLKKAARSETLVYRNAAANRVWTIEKVTDDLGAHLEGVQVTMDREDGSRALCVTAEKAAYLDGEWWFTGVKTTYYNINGEEIASPSPELDALPLRLMSGFHERPSDIQLQNRDWQFSSVRDKLRFVRKHTDITPDYRRECLYDAWAQAVAPLACLVITLFAIPAGIASGRQSVFKGILGALGMFFAFYALTLGCMAAASKGWVPPIPAALLPDAVFLALGLRAFRRQR